MTKLAIILIIGFTIPAAASTYGQGNISLKLDNVTIKDVLKAIEDQGSYRFVYKTSLLARGQQRVSVNIDNASLNEVMRIVLQNSSLTWRRVNDRLFVIIDSVTVRKAEEAATPITGKVTDAGGIGLSGVTIQEKGSSNGTTSHEDGTFSLNTDKDNPTLVLSLIGYATQEVAAGGNRTLSVSLQLLNKELQQIVVIGYGTQRKGDLTSAVATVKAENFIKGAVTDAGQLIQGKIAGLTVISPSGDPTGNTQILLRGQTTLMGANQNPLVLIDGIPGDLRTVAPQDIESIDVLKDGSAAAIYGTRGTNGVILITTKRASGNNRSDVDYSGYLSTQAVARKLNLSTASDFRAQVKAGLRKNEMADNGASTDWVKAITRTPVIQSHNLTFRGGNATTNYLINGNYNNAEGIFKKSFNQIFSGHADFNHSMFDNKLKINLNLFSSSRKWNGFNGNIYREATMQNPTSPLKNPDGTWFQELTKFDYENPVSDLMESDGQSNESNARYKSAIVFTPISGLKLSGIFSYAKRISDNGYMETKQHVSTLRDGRNGYAKIGGDESIDRLMELTAEYARNFNRHHLVLLGGYSYQENVYTSNSTENWDFPTDKFGWNDIGLGRAISSGDYQGLVNNYKSETNLVGFFGRLTYNYDERYLLMASVRREEASQLWGTKNPWGTFPAVSAGWRISRESFMASQKLFDDLKLRVGYGVTGSQPSDLFRGAGVIGYGG
ncbi:MAG TPA: SusC/RagA family TonB-linked outer membrane protein, partial [Puia sp.]